MIKIFGKYRYHWQPELSWLIIYWSLAITPIFIAAALLFELYSVPYHILMLFTIFVALFGLGFHRYFIIDDKGNLGIVSFNIFKPRKVKISDIEKIEVELMDHMTNFDYFAFYEESKKALKLKLRKKGL